MSSAIEPLAVHLRDCGPNCDDCRCICHHPRWTFTIPGSPPSVNHSYGQAGGRRFKNPGVEAYQTSAAYIVKLAKPKGWLPARRVSVTYRMWFNRDGRDASNAIKALEDAIAHALGCNDSAFLPCVVLKEKDAVNPRIEVTIQNVPS